MCALTAHHQGIGGDKVKAAHSSTLTLTPRTLISTQLRPASGRLDRVAVSSDQSLSPTLGINCEVWMLKCDPTGHCAASNRAEALRGRQRSASCYRGSVHLGHSKKGLFLIIARIMKIVILGFFNFFFLEF